MVFSVDTVLNRKNTKLSNPILDNGYDFNKSLFSEALEIISNEQDGFFEEMNQYLDEGLASSAITNMVKEFDFRTILEKIFDIFVGAIGRLGASFSAFLLNFVNDDAELKLYKNQLANYRGEVHYNKPYYEYRNFGINSFVTTEYSNIINGLQIELVNDFSNISVRSKDEMSSVLSNLLEKYSRTEDQLSLIRGKLVGKNQVSYEEYKDELFNYFRTTESPINPKAKFYQKNIKGDRIHLAYKDFYNSKKQISIIKREQWKYRAEALKAKYAVRKYSLLSGVDKSLLEPASMVTYNRIVSARCKEIQEVCNIFVLYFSAKLDAIREYNITNKELLLLACKDIVKNKHLEN